MATDERGQLFDSGIVKDILTAGILLYLMEKHEEINEDEVADFVIKNFSHIIDSITH